MTNSTSQSDNSATSELCAFCKKGYLVAEAPPTNKTDYYCNNCFKYKKPTATDALGDQSEDTFLAMTQE